MSNINKTNWFTNEMEKHKNSIEFKQEYLLLNITGQILEIIDQHNISRQDLAEDLGYSLDYIDKLFNGDVDITLNTFTRIADALDCNIDISLYETNNDQ